jgi:hypothetical protein
MEYNLKKLSSAIICGSICFSISANAGFFDKLRMALGATSIVFIEPPPIHETIKYRHLILQNNSSSNPLFSRLENNLTSFRINQSAYFDQVSTTPPATKEMKDIQWAIVDISTDLYEVHDERSSEIRAQCQNGKLVCHDNEASHFYVGCNTRTATVSGKITFRDAITQKTITADVGSDKEISKVCQDTGGNLVDSETLLGKAADVVSNKLTAKFTPKTDKQISKLIEEDSSLPIANDKLKQAYRLASSGDVNTALKIYNQLITDGTSDGIILFNAAYCEHAQGNFKKALELYQAASNAPNAPKDVIAELQTKVSDFVAAGIDTAVN